MSYRPPLSASQGGDRTISSTTLLLIVEDHRPPATTRTFIKQRLLGDGSKYPARRVCRPNLPISPPRKSFIHVQAWDVQWRAKSRERYSALTYPLPTAVSICHIHTYIHTYLSYFVIHIYIYTYKYIYSTV